MFRSVAPRIACEVLISFCSIDLVLEKEESHSYSLLVFTPACNALADTEVNPWMNLMAYYPHKLTPNSVKFNNL